MNDNKETKKKTQSKGKGKELPEAFEKETRPDQLSQAEAAEKAPDHDEEPDPKEKVEEALWETFPASDPPSYTP